MRIDDGVLVGAPWVLCVLVTSTQAISCADGCGRSSRTAPQFDAATVEPAAQPSGSAEPPAAVVDAPRFLQDGPFEGTLAVIWATASNSSSFTLRIKGQYLRLDVPHQHSYGLFDSTSGTDVNVSPGARTVTKEFWSSTMLVNLMTLRAEDDPVATGESSSVAGQACQLYRFMRTGMGAGEACVVRGAPFPMTARNELFALRFVMWDDAGKEGSRMEVTNIEQHALEDALFTIPSGYKRLPGEGFQK